MSAPPWSHQSLLKAFPKIAGCFHLQRSEQKIWRGCFPSWFGLASEQVIMNGLVGIVPWSCIRFWECQHLHGEPLELQPPDYNYSALFENTPVRESRCCHWFGFSFKTQAGLRAFRHGAKIIRSLATLSPLSRVQFKSFFEPSLSFFQWFFLNCPFWTAWFESLLKAAHSHLKVSPQGPQLVIVSFYQCAAWTMP